MYRIAVLANEDAKRKTYAEQTERFCQERGLYPAITQYPGAEQFFAQLPATAPTNAVIALPGVAGLDAVEHLHAVCPACAVIWCSDLDFSLHAFRLRVAYFLLEPVSEETFRQGLAVWFAEKKHRAPGLGQRR